MNLIGLALLALAAAAEPGAWFQAHRGGLDEVPENTLVAFEYAWGIPGAVPEVDLRTTQDGVIVCIHDETPARTTNAPAEWKDKPVKEIPSATLRTWDAGAWFDPKYAGTPVPTLDELFTALKRDPAQRLYLDIKAVELDQLGASIDAAGVRSQVLFVHGSPVMCRRLTAQFPGIPTMTWLSGEVSSVQRRFRDLAEKRFEGISQMQLHLTPKGEAPGVYELDEAFLKEAVAATQAAGIELQVRPFIFDGPSLRHLRELGIRWFVADAPRAFANALAAAEVLRPAGTP